LVGAEGDPRKTKGGGGGGGGGRGGGRGNNVTTRAKLRFPKNGNRKE